MTWATLHLICVTACWTCSYRLNEMHGVVHWCEPKWIVASWSSRVPIDPIECDNDVWMNTIVLNRIVEYNMCLNEMSCARELEWFYVLKLIWYLQVLLLPSIVAAAFLRNQKVLTFRGNLVSNQHRARFSLLWSYHLDGPLVADDDHTNTSRMD